MIYTRTPSVVDLLLSVGIPTLWEWHEAIPDYFCKFFDHSEFLGMVTTSSYLSQLFIEQGLAPNKVFIAPNAISLETLLPYQSKEIARQKLSLNKTGSIVVYSGQLHNHKGIPTVLKAAKYMPNSEFVLVGGWHEDVVRVKSICQQDSLTNVHVVGHVPQSKLPTYLYAADVLLLPTSKTWDQAEVTNPLKMFDYMTVKRPIVSSALSSIMTVLRHRENAVLVEPDNPQELSSAIAELLNNASLSNELAEQAYRDVQNHTYKQRACNILKFVDQQLESYGKKSPSRLRQTVRGLKFLFRWLTSS